MSTPIAFGRLDVELVSSTEETRVVRPEPETPFKIAVLGDFCGRHNRGMVEKPTGRRFHQVDRDNLDEILRKFSPQLTIPILGKDSPPISVRFSGLDDFHPDSLYERIEIFQALRDTREALKDPKTLAALAEQLHGGDVPQDKPPRDPGKSLEEIVLPTGGGLLDQVLEVTESKAPNAEASSPVSEWDGFLRDLVSAHFEPKTPPQLREMVEAADAAAGELMRRVLHHPDFQTLEAAWRGLQLLVSRLETDEYLRLYVLDVSKAELAGDLLAADDLRTTALHRLLVEQSVETPGGEPWAVVAGNYTFDQTGEDIEVLGRISRIMRQAGAPFISGAHPHLIGCESLSATPDPRDWRWLPEPEASRRWQMLRDLPEASHLGLSLPRFLLRLPYGSDTDPVERFEFEEMPEGAEHTRYLWGNPAFACVCLLGQGFNENGWDFRPGDILDVADLPVHTFRKAGESQIKPCAEILLTVDAAERILDKGIMPLLSFKNQDRVRLGRFQSLADPPMRLSGRWG